MRLLRWLGLALLAALAAAFAVGRPVAWGEAALIIWDVAAGGQPTWWQDVTAKPREYPAKWADGEGDVYAPAVIAALETDPAFIVGIGGYRDSEAAIRFVTTGAFRPLRDSREFRVTPGMYGRWVFLLANAGRLDDANDAQVLQTIATARLRNPAADVGPLAARLGPQGRAVLALVENRDPDTVTQLVAALPERVRREIDGLNLALYDLSKLRGHLILVHGRGDPLVPYSESQALAAAASNARVSLFLVDDLGHVDFNAVALANAWTMWRAADALLGERR